MEPCTIDELVSIARSYGPGMSAAAESLAALLTDLVVRSAALKPAAVLDLVLDATGLGDWLGQQPDGPDSAKRLEMLRGLLEQASDGLAAWLDDLALTSGADTVSGEADAVLLSTIHRAKGCEWPTVFAVGLEEGLLPHARALDSGASAMEGELRVAYVAMTRARERLYLTYCRSRDRGGLPELRRPSRFLGAVDVGSAQRAA